MKDDLISICAVKACNCHLDTRYANPHPTISGGHLCPSHEYMHVDGGSPCAASTVKDYAYHMNQLAASRSKQPEPAIIHEIPDKAHKVSARVSMWTSEGYARLEQGLGLSRREFEKTFEGGE